MLNNSMKMNAYLYISTDWENYAESIAEILNNSEFFKSSTKKLLEKKRLSKFEKRGEEQGRQIFNFNYQKIN